VNLGLRPDVVTARAFLSLASSRARKRVFMQRLFCLVSSLFVVAAIGSQATAAVPECDIVDGDTTYATTLEPDPDGTYTLREHAASDMSSWLEYELPGLTCSFGEGELAADCQVGERQLTVTADSEVRWQVDAGESPEWTNIYLVDACKFTSDDEPPVSE